MRIGVCGGTFDPFHRGHLEPILTAYKTLGVWDTILYIPAAQQPFKLGQPGASGHHRFAMAQLATRNYDQIWVTPMELERGGPSYTVDTLEELHRAYDAEFDWVIGDDNVADFDRWKNPARLLTLARFVVLTRTGAQPDPRFTYAKNDVVTVSSTEIRRRVRAGEAIDAFVDPLVSRYIHHNGLYKEDQT